MTKRSNRKLHPVEKADLAVAEAVAVPSRSRAGRWLDAFAELGDQPPLIAASAGVAVAGLATRERKLVRTGLRMLAAHGLATAAKLIIKDRVDRTRPAEARRNGRYKLQPGESRDGRLRSMPSGHSAGLAAVAAAVAREYPGAGPVAAAGAGSIIAAQLPSENHFVSDVAVGVAIGLAAEQLAAMILPDARPAPA